MVTCGAVSHVDCGISAQYDTDLIYRVVLKPLVRAGHTAYATKTVGGNGL